jgi:NADH-quinone oxidoreductase subunit F
MAEMKVLTRDFGREGLLSLKGYERAGGYGAFKKALQELSPDSLIEMVKKSGLRGRGGAGFPTGNKWGFLPKGVYPRYLVCNADESEPGCFKDRYLIDESPHQVIEGILIAAFAIGCNTAFIYIRGEYLSQAELLETALEEARAAGYIGRNVLGSGFDVDVLLHRGAGAYICGEETALFNSIEGFRGEPRNKPPFPRPSGSSASRPS